MEAALLEARSALPAAAAMAAGLVSPSPRVLETFPCEPGRPRGTDAAPLDKAQKHPRADGTPPPAGPPPGHEAHAPSPPLPQAWKNVLRGCGRHGRGHGHGCVNRVRPTAQPLLALGRAPHRAGAAHPATPCPGAPPERRHARAFHRDVHRCQAPRCGPPPALPPAPPRANTPPLYTRPCLRSPYRSPPHRPEQWSRALWAEAGQRVGPSHGRALCQPRARRASARAQRWVASPGQGPEGDGTRQGPAAPSRARRGRCPRPQ